MIRFAVVGCGHIAKKHIQAIERIDRAQLVAVCDKDMEKMEPYKYVSTYSDFERLLCDEQIDVVNICTPSGLHKQQALQAARHGKHIILEKPMALTSADAREIINVCSEHGVKLAIVHPNRFKPAIQLLHWLIQTNKLGTISHVSVSVRWNRRQSYYDEVAWRGTKSLDGGVLMNQAIHALDLLLWMFGDVQCAHGYHATRIKSIETDDVVVGIMKFRSGVLGVVEATVNVYEQSLEESIFVTGSKGTVKIGGASIGTIEHLAIEGVSEKQIEEWKQMFHYGASVFGHDRIIEDMIECIVHDRQPFISGEAGYKVIELIEKFYASHK